VPLHLTIVRAAAGETTGVTLNGRPVARAEVADIGAHRQLDFCLRIAAP